VGDTNIKSPDVYATGSGPQRVTVNGRMGLKRTTEGSSEWLHQPLERSTVQKLDEKGRTAGASAGGASGAARETSVVRKRRRAAQIKPWQVDHGSRIKGDINGTEAEKGRQRRTGKSVIKEGVPPEEKGVPPSHVAKIGTRKEKPHFQIASL